MGVCFSYEGDARRGDSTTSLSTSSANKGSSQQQQQQQREENLVVLPHCRLTNTTATATTATTSDVAPLSTTTTSPTKPRDLTTGSHSDSTFHCADISVREICVGAGPSLRLKARASSCSYSSGTDSNASGDLGSAASRVNPLSLLHRDVVAGSTPSPPLALGSQFSRSRRRRNTQRSGVFESTVTVQAPTPLLHHPTPSTGTPTSRVTPKPSQWQVVLSPPQRSALRQTASAATSLHHEPLPLHRPPCHQQRVASLGDTPSIAFEQLRGINSSPLPWNTSSTASSTGSTLTAGAAPISGVLALVKFKEHLLPPIHNKGPINLVVGVDVK